MLHPCDECGETISDKAPACPHCGNPRNNGTVPLDYRKDVLAQGIATRLARPGKWRVETQTDTYAIVVGGQPVNHILHLLLTVLTLGLWVIVWIIVAAGGGEKRYKLEVDEAGNGTTRRL